MIEKFHSHLFFFHSHFFLFYFSLNPNCLFFLAHIIMLAQRPSSSITANPKKDAVSVKCRVPTSYVLPCVVAIWRPSQSAFGLYLFQESNSRKGFKLSTLSPDLQQFYDQITQPNTMKCEFHAYCDHLSRLQRKSQSTIVSLRRVANVFLASQGVIFDVVGNPQLDGSRDYLIPSPFYLRFKMIDQNASISSSLRRHSAVPIMTRLFHPNQVTSRSIEWNFDTNSSGDLWTRLGVTIPRIRDILFLSQFSDRTRVLSSRRCYSLKRDQPGFPYRQAFPYRIETEGQLWIAQDKCILRNDQSDFFPVDWWLLPPSPVPPNPPSPPPSSLNDHDTKKRKRENEPPAVITYPLHSLSNVVAGQIAKNENCPISQQPLMEGEFFYVNLKMAECSHVLRADLPEYPAPVDNVCPFRCSNPGKWIRVPRPSGLFFD